MATIVNLGNEILPSAINDNGQVVGTDHSAPGAERGFIYQNGIITDIAPPSGYAYSTAVGINLSGQIAGSAEYNKTGSPDYPFLDTDGTLTDLGELSGYPNAYAAGLNNNGQVVGNAEFSSAGLEHAFLYSGGQMTDLGPNGYNSRAEGINNAGEVVGEASFSGLSGRDLYAFIYSGGQMTDLGSLPGSGDNDGEISDATGINDNGQVIGYAHILTSPNQPTSVHAFIDSNGQMTDLGSLGGGTSSPLAINDNGQVVGISSTATGQEHAFYYAGGVMADLNSYLPANSGWTLVQATAINDNGQIVGYGTYNGKNYEGFLLNLNKPTSTPNISIASSLNPSTYGQPVTFTATVSAAASGLPTPTGTVKFMDGKTLLYTGTLNAAGMATFTMTTADSLAVGAHFITVAYGGDSTFSSSTSSPITQMVDFTTFTIVSFSKNAAANPLYSNGDYDLTYQVSGDNLLYNPNLTLAVYWAAGPNVTNIIPDLPPVASGQLQQTPSSSPYLFCVHASQLINPPSNATTLIAVLDSQHILPSLELINNDTSLSTAGAPIGYTSLNAPLSAELEYLPHAVAPDAPTREQRVRLWLREYSGNILRAAANFQVDPVAIAGAIAWEALQNVKTNLVYPLGPGKVHPVGENGQPSAAAVVEGNLRYRPELPVQNVLTRILLLETPGGAIRYIAAIMNAYSYEAEHAPHGRDIRQMPGILATYYNGVAGFALQNAATAFAQRFQNPSPLMDGPTMGQWVDYNAEFLKSALGIN